MSEVLREMCPYSDLFWSLFSRVPGLNTVKYEYGKIRTRITPTTDTFYALKLFNLVLTSKTWRPKKYKECEVVF